MGEIKEIKCLAAKTAFSSENNKPVTVLALVESSRKKVKIAKDYKLMNCSVVESFRKDIKMAKSSGSRPSTTKARRSENFYDCFNLIVFQIGHVSLTSANTL